MARASGLLLLGFVHIEFTVVQLLREWEDRAARRNSLPPFGPFQPHVWYLAYHRGLFLTFSLVLDGPFGSHVSALSFRCRELVLSCEAVTSRACECV